MIRYVLVASAFVLTTSFVLAQTPHEPFSTFMSGQPNATTPLTNEPLLVLQGGIAKKVPVSSLPFPPAPPTSITVGGTPLAGGTLGDCLSVGAGFVNAQTCGVGPGGNSVIDWLSPITDGAAGTDRTTSGTIQTGTTGLGLVSTAGWTTGAGLWVMGAGLGGFNTDLTSTIVTMAPVTVTLAGAAGATAYNTAVGPLGSMAVGSNVLTVSNALGWAPNNGIVVKGAGGGGGDLTTTVSAVTGSTLTLVASAGTTATNAIVIHDDTAAINSTIVSALSAGSAVYFPAGNYNVSSSLTTMSRPIMIQGDNPFVTKIYNRSTTATVLTIAYHAPAGGYGGCCTGAVGNDFHFLGASVRNLSMIQATDVVPTTGSMIQIGAVPSNNQVVWGFLLQNFQAIGGYADIQVVGPQGGNFFTDMVLNTAVSGFPIIYDSITPDGDDWWNNIFISGGVKIVSSDTTLWSNIKVDGGQPLLFAAKSAADIQNISFNNIRFENQALAGIPCSIDFGTNGVANGIQFTGGGFFFGANSFSDTDACHYFERGGTTFVGFLNSNDDFNINVGQGTIQDKWIITSGDTAPGCRLCNVFGIFNEFDEQDPGGGGKPVLGVLASSTNAQGHLVYGGFGAGGRNFLWGVDAAGQAYQSNLVVPFNGSGTAGNIQVLPANGFVSDATAGTVDGALGIAVPAIGAGMSAPLINSPAIGNGDLVVVSGYAPCNIDSSGATLGNWATFSTITAGACHDAGRARPTHGVGRIFSTVATAGVTTILVQIF